MAMDIDDEVNGGEEQEAPDALRKKWESEEDRPCDGRSVMMACPHCGREINRESFSCLFCGRRVFTASGPLGKLAAWFAAGRWGIAVFILVALLVALGFLLS